MNNKQAREASEAEELLALRESIARHQIVMETASDAIITIDETSTILFANRATEKVFGYTSAELRGAPLTMLMPEYMRRLHEVGIKRYHETGHKHISWAGVELPGLHKSGREIVLEISFGEFTQQEKHFYTGIARDISERKAAERRLAVQYAVTHILAESATVGAASSKILRAIYDALGWELSAFWRVDREAQVLRCIETWHAPTIEAGEFEVVSRERTFERGVGLPGRVWSSGEPAWVAEIAQNGNLPRAAVAARHGLHSAFAFPVRLGAEVLGVIEYFSRESREPDASLLELMSTIGSQIGQFIERRRAENERTSLQEELIRVQTAQLVELSTPLIPLTNDIVVMPLIGTIDAARAQRMLDTLLHGLQARRAAVAIIDITGVSVVDAHVAHTLVQASRSARLLGTEAVLTGIRPGVARSLRQSGFEAHDLTTRKTLQDGILRAFEILRQRRGAHIAEMI
ncbi:MAG TPA: PAS domain S-box protein [Pyrinomonadaceae bacterium]|jgi:PAS domain S-box-containing protein|nr:PAS domain S-box protein [Pyrinomonadaceae bacterium]